MHVFVTTNKKEKYHYDDTKEIYVKDWASVIIFNKYGSMNHFNIEDVVKVEIIP